MEKIMLELHPCAGSVEEKGCYRATVATGRGNVAGLDEIVEFAFDRGYIYGIKKEAVKSVVRGLFDSIIAGITEDGRTRRIDDYLSVALKVHGRFEDEHDEFDRERHSFSLSLAPLRAFRPSFKGVEATNPKHKRQFRIYSVMSTDVEKPKNRTLIWGRDIIVKGADFNMDDSLGVTMHVTSHKDRERGASVDPTIISRSETELRFAWPAELNDPVFDSAKAEVVVSRLKNPQDPNEGVDRREMCATITTED